MTRGWFSCHTGELGSPTKTVTYRYDDADWGDLLTEYDGNAITYDQIGNPLSDGTRSYTWRHGRQLATLTENGTTWTNTYDADGMRVSRSNGTNTYVYVYDGSSLAYMSYNDKVMRFAHAPDGTPLSIVYQDRAYYYVTNLQGDVVGLVNSSGVLQVAYSYDAWGNILSVTGPMAATLGAHNPLRYRGYVYDPETQLYYLQSRYYDPWTGRFINADNYTSTGQGILGNNMFAYCGNNPCNFKDPTGHATGEIMAAILKGLGDTATVVAVAIVAVAAVYLLTTVVTAAVEAASKVVSDLSNAIADVAAKTVEKLTKREHNVYHLKDGDKVEYVGRTKNVDQQEKAHGRDPNRKHLKFEVITPGLTYVEARALEQASMVCHHTINTANRMNNQINGISPKYWEEFKEIALGTMDYAENQITNKILCWAEG